MKHEEGYVIFDHELDFQGWEIVGSEEMNNEADGFRVYIRRFTSKGMEFRTVYTSRSIMILILGNAISLAKSILDKQE